MHYIIPYRSTDSGKVNEYGETGRILSTGRTSTNSWCKGACMDHIHVNTLTSRIEGAVGVARENYENFQVLRCK